MSNAQKYADRAPTLWIDPDAFDKIMTYITLCPKEINDFAYVTRIDAKTLAIRKADDVFITD